MADFVLYRAQKDLKLDKGKIPVSLTNQINLLHAKVRDYVSERAYACVCARACVCVGVSECSYCECKGVLCYTPIPPPQALCGMNSLDSAIKILEELYTRHSIRSVDNIHACIHIYTHTSLISLYIKLKLYRLTNQIDTHIRILTLDFILIRTSAPSSPRSPHPHIHMHPPPHPHIHMHTHSLVD